VTLEQRLLLRRDFTYAVRMVRAAMEDDLIKMLEHLRDDNCVQRCWRDVHAISSHVVMNFDMAAETFGGRSSGRGATRRIRCFEGVGPFDCLTMFAICSLLVVVKSTCANR
jgi:hypothetical protein